MIRSAMLVTLGIFVTWFIATFILVLSFLAPNENRMHKLASLWARAMLFLSNTKVDVKGAENIPPGKPAVFMANHQSDFDIFIVLAHVPVQFRWLAKKELFHIPIFGPAMRTAGYIEIDRQNREKAFKSLDEAAEKIGQGKSVMTFPEGTRSRDGRMKTFKQGTFYLAIKSGAPIIPVSIIGSGEIMPKRSLQVNPGRIIMAIDKPIPVTGYTIDTRAELIERVQSVILKNYDYWKAVRQGDATDAGRAAA